MRLSELPLCSSDRTEKALLRLDCYLGRAKGSHQAIYRDSEGETLAAILVLGRKKLPKLTLKGILVKLDISLEDFLAALR